MVANLSALFSLKVVNYGIAGQYEPHVDNALVNSSVIYLQIVLYFFVIISLVSNSLILKFTLYFPLAVQEIRHL